MTRDARTLAAEALSVVYPDGRRALEGVNLSVRPGELHLVLGATGSGKSTLLLALAGVLPQAQAATLAGAVTLDGAPTARLALAALATRVQLLLQNAEAHFVAPTVAEDVLFGPANLGLPAAEVRARAGAALAAAGAEHLAARHPATLSGGEARAAALAGALAMGAEFLLLDEPFTDLDPAARATLARTLAALKSRGTGLVVAEHRTAELLDLADAVTVLDAGRLALQGAPGEVFGRLVAAGGKLDGRALRLPARVEAAVALGLDPLAGEAQVLAAAAARPAAVRPLLARLAGVPTSAAASGAPLLAARALGYRYPGGTEALRGVSLELRRGEVLALVGANGAGKSTLAQLFCGLLRPSAGELAPAGGGGGRSALRTALILQRPELQLFCSSVAEELEFGPRNLGRPAGEARARAAAAAARFELEPLLDRHPQTLSRGQMRALAAAAGLALDPELFILDEPTVGQDAAGLAAVGRAVAAAREAGAATVLITHDLELALALAGRAAVLARGELVADGPPAAVLGEAATLERARLAAPFVLRLAEAARSGEEAAR